MGVKEEAWGEAGALGEADADLPVWAVDYEPVFREIVRTLSFYEGFALIPVELPASGGAPPMRLVQRLAEWLSKKGVQLRQFVLEETGWETFTPELLSLRLGAGAAVAVV